jgi:hypothetical protein
VRIEDFTTNDKFHSFLSKSPFVSVSHSALNVDARGVPFGRSSAMIIQNLLKLFLLRQRPIQTSCTIGTILVLEMNNFDQVSNLKII